MSGDQTNGQGGVEGWMPPREDINAPDLYIPSESGYTPSFGRAAAELSD